MAILVSSESNGNVGGGEETKIEANHLQTTIFVIDDEQIMRDMLTDVLQEEGYNVRGFSLARDALKYAAENKVEIIITDIIMQEMNGIELLEKIKEINSDIDVIVMTGYATVETAVKAMKLGAIDYLTKPLNIDQIRIIISKALQQRVLKKRAEEADFYKKLSRLDSLTELFNLRAFQQLLGIEIARAEREKWPVSLVMLDIDDFKAFNDTNGHPMGNLVLKRLSWLLKQNCRNCDFVARYGGEEFTIIFPHTGKEDAEIMANRIRKAVEENGFEQDGLSAKYNFTISLGVAEYPVDAEDKDNLIEKADQALYQAKREGKNRVAVYNG